MVSKEDGVISIQDNTVKNVNLFKIGLVQRYLSNTYTDLLMYHLRCHNWNIVLHAGNLINYD